VKDTTPHLTGIEAVFYEIDDSISKLAGLKEKIKRAGCIEENLLRSISYDIHENVNLAIDAIIGNLQAWRVLGNEGGPGSK
jgi:hypothetical protein